jgi:hypothetical protein
MMDVMKGRKASRYSAGCFYFFNERDAGGVATVRNRIYNIILKRP